MSQTQVEITSFFTRNGTPITTLSDGNPYPDGNSYPSIRIWDVTDGIHDLVVGTTNGSGSNVDGVMVPVVDAAETDGFYLYTFTVANGYDHTKQYLIRTDGGPALSKAERFQVSTIQPDIDPNTIADIILDEQVNDHLLPGTVGLAIAQTKATTEQLALNVGDIENIVSTLTKYDTNRTKIDPVAKTLTVYDDDCTTVLRVFNLFDQHGQQSVDSVCERVPVVATDGNPTC